MKTAICYYSRHHGNTRKVLDAMAQRNDIDLIDVTSRVAVHLEDYDCIGFASGIYYSKFQETVLDFVRQYLPQGKDVFFVYTCGSMRKGYTKAISEIVADKDANILGEYGCRGSLREEKDYENSHLLLLPAPWKYPESPGGHGTGKRY